MNIKPLIDSCAIKDRILSLRSPATWKEELAGAQSTHRYLYKGCRQMTRLWQVLKPTAKDQENYSVWHKKLPEGDAGK